jgi:hypothetical protein
MNVRELIEWLTAFHDQEAVIKVVVNQSGSGYYTQGGIAAAVEFNPELHTDYTDLRGNPRIPPDARYYGKRTLLLGEIDG